MVQPYFDLLPNEIIERIVIYVGPYKPSHEWNQHIKQYQPDLKTQRGMRLLSKRFCNIVSPITFYLVRFSMWILPSKEHCVEMLSVPPHKLIPIFSHTRFLFFMSVDQSKRQDHQIRLDLLVRLLSTMPKLSTIHWNYSFGRAYSESQLNTIMTSFASCKTLKNMSIFFGGTPNIDFSLKPLSDLHKFKITWSSHVKPNPGLITEISTLAQRCPQLEGFSFEVKGAFHRSRRFQPSLTFKEMFYRNTGSLKLRSLELRSVVFTSDDIDEIFDQLNNLEILKLQFNLDPSAPTVLDKLLCSFHDNRIYLKEISIDIIHPPNVLKYLSSYSGLVKLTVLPVHPLDDSSHVLDTFFTSIIPKHSRSLKYLEVGADKPTIWSRTLTQEQLDAVESCHYLENLQFWPHITPDDVQSRNAEVLERWLRTCQRMHSLTRVVCGPITCKEAIANINDVHTEMTIGEDPDPKIEAFVLDIMKFFWNNRFSIEFADMRWSFRY